MDFNDYSQERTIHWKPIIFGVVGVVLCVVVLIIVIGWIQDDEQDSVSEVLDVQEEVEQIVDSCEEAQDKERCRDGALTDLAHDSVAENICAIIETQSARDNCYWGLAQEQNDSKYCVSIADSVSLVRCFDDVNQKIALLAQDAALCEFIQDEIRRVRCEKILEKDIDQDGLDGAQEISYSTDPKNPDTDGDGYQDGEEVAAGYDPNGPGKLE